MFLTNLKIEIIGEQLFKLTDSLIYEDSEYRIEILAGFVFNGGSIPRLLWGIIDSPLGGIGSSCFCLHDVLYATQIVGRYKADRMLYRALLAVGMNRAKAVSIYLAVRAAGQSAFDDINSSDMDWNYVIITSKD